MAATKPPWLNYRGKWRLYAWDVNAACAGESGTCPRAPRWEWCGTLFCHTCAEHMRVVLDRLEQG